MVTKGYAHLNKPACLFKFVWPFATTWPEWVKHNYCFNECNILIDEEMSILKFCHISNINRQYCVEHLACLTLFWFMPHLYTHTSIHTGAHTRIHTHTHRHTHTHTHTHTFKLSDFWKNHAIKYTSYWDNTGPRNLMHSKFKFFKW